MLIGQDKGIKYWLIDQYFVPFIDKNIQKYCSFYLGWTVSDSYGFKSAQPRDSPCGAMLNTPYFAPIHFPGLA